MVSLVKASSLFLRSLAFVGNPGRTVETRRQGLIAVFHLSKTARPGFAQEENGTYLESKPDSESTKETPSSHLPACTGCFQHGTARDEWW